MGLLRRMCMGSEHSAHAAASARRIIVIVREAHDLPSEHAAKRYIAQFFGKPHVRNGCGQSVASCTILFSLAQREKAACPVAYQNACVYSFEGMHHFPGAKTYLMASCRLVNGSCMVLRGCLNVLCRSTMSAPPIRRLRPPTLSRKIHVRRYRCIDAK